MFTEEIDHLTEIEAQQVLEEDFWSTDELDDEEDSKFATYRNSARIYVAFIIGIGIVGNVACLVLYRRPSFCRYRSSRYLTALAIADLTSLICLGLIWLKGLGIRWQDRSEFACAVSIYASNSATFLSAWFVMLLTADMAWTLRRPYRMNIFEENRSILGRILAVTFIGLVANSWTWSAAKIMGEEPNDQVASNLAAATPTKWPWMSENGTTGIMNSTIALYGLVQKLMNSSATTASDFQSGDGGCQLTFNADEYFARWMTIFDMMVSFTIPLVITLVLNGYIGCKLMTSARRRRYLSEAVMRAKHRTSSFNHNRNVRRTVITVSIPRNQTRPLIHETDCADDFRPVIPLSIPKHQVKRRRRSLLSGLGKEATVSSLLIAKSITYLALNLPTHAYRFWSIFREPSESPTEDEMEREFLVNMVVYVLFYTQFSLNFILYSGHACKKRGNGP